MRRSFTLGLYNLAPPGPNRGLVQVHRELVALTKPRRLRRKMLMLGLCEAIGHRLPDLPGMRLYRDLSKQGRANIAVYVADQVHVQRTDWHDAHETWGRTEHGGIHPARSWFEIWADDWQFVFGQQPPKYTDNVVPSQQEGIDLLEKLMVPWGHSDWHDLRPEAREADLQTPRVAAADYNRRRSESGPGPQVLARTLDGTVASDRIDTAVGRRVKFGKPHYVHTIGGVTLKSDHKEALIVTATRKAK